MKSIFLLLISLLCLSSCNPSQTTLGDEFFAGVTISLSHSTLTVSNSQVATSNSIEVTLKLKDQNGVPHISKRPVITFSKSGGTSVGTLSSVTNLGNGTYTATFSGVTPGTPTTLHAQVDGEEITSTLPTVKVTTGNFSLSNSTIIVSNATVTSGETLIVTLISRDVSNTQLPDGGLSVAFSHSGGTSTGTFGPVSDNTNGTYSATLIGITAGTVTNIYATIGEGVVTSAAPTIIVSPGAVATIAVLTGNTQSAVAGSAVTNPLEAVVKDSNNNLKSGVNVSWSVTGGGAVSSCTTTTDANGLAECIFTTGTTAGTNTITAGVTGIATPATFTATGTAGAVESITVLSGDAQSATVGSALSLPLIAIVKDINNNVINGAVVDWVVTSGGGAVSSCSPVTNSSGLAQCALTIGTTAGANTVTATVDGTAITTSFGATGTAGAISLTQSTLTISSSSVTSNSPVTLTITLKDTYGNQVANSSQASNLSITVLATGTSSGTVGAIAAVGGNDGAYQASFTGTTAGTANTIKASLSTSDFTSTKPSFTVTFGTAIKLAFVQEPTAVASGSSISPSVTVRALDINNNFVSTYATDIVMAIDTNPSTGTLAGTLTKTPSSGVATFNDLSINYYGTGYKLSATSGTLLAATSAAYNVTATAVGYSLPFTAGTTSDYTASSWTNIEFVNDPDPDPARDYVRLIPTIQTDSVAATGTMSAGTASGVVIGTLTDGVNSGLKLGNGGVCDGSSTNCAELDWTPQWASLISYWKMNNTWTDSRGTVNGTGVGSPTFTASAKIGSHGGTFNGANSVDFGSQNLNIGSSFSIIGWIKASTDASTFRVFLNKGPKNAGHFELYLWSGTGDLRFYSNDLGDKSAAKTINDNSWHHFAVTFDGSNVRWYVDGIKTNTIATTGTIASESETFTIGAGSGYVFLGSLDDIAIFSVPMSDLEVVSIYERQKSQYSGIFTSRIMDAKSSSSWTTLSWIPTLPFLKELPDYAGGAIQNEVSSGANGYSNLASNTLMTGIKGLWHLNEPSVTTGANNDFKDDSGNSNFAEASGAIPGSSGILDKAVTFDGVNNHLTISNLTSLQTLQNSNYTLSLWYKPRLLPNGTGSANTSHHGLLMKNGFHLGLTYNATGKFTMFHWLTGNVDTAVTSTNTFPINQFHHVLGVVDVSAGTIKIYVNGNLEGTKTWTPNTATLNYGTSTWKIGIASPSAGTYRWAADGVIDEVAVWGRALEINEVKQLYQRGASRIKYQVRSCASNDPTCASAAWKGPDGTSGSYFSELNNNTIPASGAGDVKASLPVMDWTTSSANFPSVYTLTGQYFQYRTIFESDTPTTALMPELKSVKVDPIHYDASSPSIYGNNGIQFSELNAFTENVTTPTSTATCSSGIGYNLSLDKTIWKYWNGSAWATANGTPTQSNVASDIQANAATFGTQVGKGTVYVKAYLKSSGTSKCELDNIQISGNR